MKSSVWRRGFLLTVLVILLATATAKVITVLQVDGGHGGAGPGGLLSLPAPYVPTLTNRDMMWVAVGFELTVLSGLTRLRTDRARLLLVAFVGGVFAAYHLGLGVIGYQHPCGCLGGPLDWWHLSRRAYDTLTIAIIVYLLVGSYALLLWDGMRSLQRLPQTAGAGLHPTEPAR